MQDVKDPNNVNAVPAVTGDSDRDAFIRDNLHGRFRLWLRRASLWGAVIFMLLSGLDYVATPENFRHFLNYRMAVSSLLLAVWLISRWYDSRGILLHKALGLLAITASAVTIQLMILEFGGHASPYYAGLILLIVCVTGFIPARITYHASYLLLIYAIYLTPILLLDEIKDFKYFFTANVFIIAVILTSLIMRYLSEQGLTSELGLKYELEQQQIDLETLISERTQTLEDAIRDLEREVNERMKAERKLEDMVREKGNFITRLGHDLKTPLTPLVTLLPLVREQEQDPKLKEILDVNIANANFMKELTIKTLKLARHTAPTDRPPPEEIDLGEKVDGYITKRADLIARHNITVNNNIGPVTVLADGTELEELFYNFLTNAIKYSPDHSTISIDAAAGGDTLTVSVRDEGIGLTEEQVGHVFDEFYKVDASRHELDSSGLGLSICRKIIENNGGRIWAESPGPGRGSTFYFTLTLAQVKEKG